MTEPRKRRNPPPARGSVTAKRPKPIAEPRQPKGNAVGITEPVRWWKSELTGMTVTNLPPGAVTTCVMYGHECRSASHVHAVPTNKETTGVRAVS